MNVEVYMKRYLLILCAAIFLAGCTDTVVEEDVVQVDAITEKSQSEQQTDTEEKLENTATQETEKSVAAEATTKDDLFAGYKLIEVDGGNLSGHRQANVVVDIGFGEREYWAFTNEHGQLVRVIADEITLQDDQREPVLSSGRYYPDEAKVPGVESSTLDEGHIIADSLGGVANAYNITPQDSTLNRHGDQAYMEDAIRKAGGATNFEAIITYPNSKTQTPSHYDYTYTIKGEKIVDSYPNGNPDKKNEELGLTSNKAETPVKAPEQTNAAGDIASVDTNGNGQVTIKEAKAAGFKMPITRDHWIYQYMHDADGDGTVGE